VPTHKKNHPDFNHLPRRKVQDMKRNLLLVASAVAMLATSAQAADNSHVPTSRRIPPIPASGRFQVPPPAVTPASAKPAAAQPAAANIIKVAESKPYVSKGDTVQSFVDYINLKPGQEKLPLTLTFNNLNFQSASCTIAGYPVLNRQKLTNSPLVINMTGNLGSGSSQILINAIGPKDSTLSWVITTPKPTVKAAKPLEVGPGDTVTISGTNFCPTAQYDVVNFAKKKAEVTGATADALQVTVPDGLEGGKQKVDVIIIGQKAGSVEITIKAQPELSSVSLSSAPPGQEITLSGKNFSKTLSENKVTIGGANAEVISGDTTSLTVTIPTALDLDSNPAYGVPIFVQVGKLKSKEDVTIDISQRVY
jgi:hypothetical protein